MTQSPPISIYQLAQQLGVSTTTISRVLNGREGIGSETRQRVWDAARASGFRPRLAIRRRTVGVVQDFIEDHFMGTMLSSLKTNVDKALTDKSFSMETFGTRNIETITDRYLDAVLAIAWETKTLDVLRELSKTIPVVIFNRPEVQELSSVSSDLVQGGKMVAEHLWSMGHRRIGILCAKPYEESDEYREGMRQYIEAQGGTFNENNTAYNHYRSSLGPLKQLLAANVTAIFLSNSELTYEVPYLCMEGLNLHIPRDLSLVGLDVNPALQFYRPPMTVLKENVSKMAIMGVQLLEQHIEQHELSVQKLTLDHDLVIRESVTVPRDLSL